MSQPHLSNQCWCLYTSISLKAEVSRSVKQEDKVRELNASMYNAIQFGELQKGKERVPSLQNSLVLFVSFSD